MTITPQKKGLHMSLCCSRQIILCHRPQQICNFTSNDKQKAKVPSTHPDKYNRSAFSHVKTVQLNVHYFHLNPLQSCKSCNARFKTSVNTANNLYMITPVTFSQIQYFIPRLSTRKTLRTFLHRLYELTHHCGYEGICYRLLHYE